VYDRSCGKLKELKGPRPSLLRIWPNGQDDELEAELGRTGMVLSITAMAAGAVMYRAVTTTIATAFVFPRSGSSS
jgi:hypothetical protein